MPNPRHTRPILLLALLLAVPPVRSAAPDEAELARQRTDFLAAEQALDARKDARYRQLLRGLSDYPLLPYLEYRRLRGDLVRASSEEIERFLTQHADTPLAGLLRNVWLEQLARHGRWRDYLRFYRSGSDTERHCHYINALINTGQLSRAMPLVKAVWLHGESQPKACDPVFKTWSDNGGKSETLVWQRIALAMERNNTRLARYLGRSLPTGQQPRLGRWVEIHRDPARLAGHLKALAASPQGGRIALHGFSRLAARDPQQALRLWHTTQLPDLLDEGERYRARRALGLRLAARNHPEAITWLDSFAPTTTDQRLHETRLRLALQQRQWLQARGWIEALPKRLGESERWRYWRARVLRELGEDEAAEALLRRLAGERSYHGFLAADLLGSDYHLTHTPLLLEQALIEGVARLPGVARARELLHLDRYLDARREWSLVTTGMEREQLQAAAKLAQSWQWHDRAIFTLARTKHWDDLELRFPLQHARHITAKALNQKLDDSWVYAVVRQESAFSHDAVSPSGARGLMQLMPATARYVAKKMKLGKVTKGDLFDPLTNITLGTHYLRMISEGLDNNQVLATAAYNAGPNRVKTWLPEQTTAPDLWIETIPFTETRSYTQRVMAYAVIYDSRRGKQPLRLSERMPPVKPLAQDMVAQSPRPQTTPESGEGT